MIAKLPNNPYNILKTFMRGLFLKINELVDAANGDTSTTAPEVIIFDTQTEGIGKTLEVLTNKLFKTAQGGSNFSNDDSIFSNQWFYPIVTAAVPIPSIFGGVCQRLEGAIYLQRLCSTAPIIGAQALDCIDNDADSGNAIVITEITANQITYDVTRANKTNFESSVTTYMLLNF